MECFLVLAKRLLQGGMSSPYEVRSAGAEGGAAHTPAAGEAVAADGAFAGSGMRKGAGFRGAASPQHLGASGW